MLKTQLAKSASIVMLSGLVTMAWVAPSQAAQPQAKRSQSSIPSGPIIFGASEDMSGAAASYGASAAKAFQVIQDDFAKAHPNGIAGHKLIIRIYNSQSTTVGAVQAANEMIADRVAAVVTVSTSAISQAQQMAVLAKAHVPTMGALVGMDYANTKLYPYAFGSLPSLQQIGTTSAQWIGARHFKRIAVLTDGTEQNVQTVNGIEQNLHRYAPHATVVNSVTVPEGTVDYSAAVSKLRSSHPDVVIAYLNLGFGPLWQAIRGTGWSPAILTNPGAWFDGFTAMGPLATTSYAPFAACASSPTQQFTDEQQSLMDAISKSTGGFSTDYLSSVAAEAAPVQIMASAIGTSHSVDPQAIKTAVEGMHNATILGFNYKLSPRNHFGLSGAFGSAICNMAPPYAGGLGKVPTRATT